MPARFSIALASFLLAAPALADADTTHEEREDTSAEHDHLFGIQVGGAGVVLADYRLNIWGPLWVDVGAFGAPHGLNVSMGIVVHAWEQQDWHLYAGGGASYAAAFGTTYEDGCDPATTECEGESSSSSIGFGYGRVGLALKLGASEQHRLSLDAGFWWGSATDREGSHSSSETFLWPMGGLGYHYAF